VLFEFSFIRDAAYWGERRGEGWLLGGTDGFQSVCREGMDSAETRAEKAVNARGRGARFRGYLKAEKSTLPRERGKGVDMGGLGFAEILP